MKSSLSKTLPISFLASEKNPGAKARPSRLPDAVTSAALKLFAARFGWQSSLADLLQSRDGWINFSIGLKTQDNSVDQALFFKDGKVRVRPFSGPDVDLTMEFADTSVLKRMITGSASELMNLVLHNQIVMSGNLVCLQFFSYLLQKQAAPVERLKNLGPALSQIFESRKTEPPSTQAQKPLAEDRRGVSGLAGLAGPDAGAKFLEDPYFSEWGQKDFPRIQNFYDLHFSVSPRICAERPVLWTRFFRDNNLDPAGPRPALRQARAFEFLMQNKKPRIRKNDLLAGTTTSYDVGVTLFPDGHAAMVWSELETMSDRELAPLYCDPETAQTLHKEVFPFWKDSNFREYVRNNFDYPLGQRIDERFVAYFVWKSVGISHTIPDFSRIMEKGTSGVQAEIQARLNDKGLDQNQEDQLKAMDLCLSAMAQYAAHLAEEAAGQAAREADPQRKKELERIAAACANVPEKPPQTLFEAVQSIWTTWVGMHLENTNTGLSIGRLDQLLQPCFERDMAALKTKEERREYAKQAVELVADFFLRMADHYPLTPDIANHLFGGAGSTQAVTLGGVKPDGTDAVNDMTYVILKAVEMFPIRDVNINARFHPEHNSQQYLDRLCEVNLITTATPIMHSDPVVFSSLKQHGYPQEHVNDWCATGCVEPSLTGRHFGHTGSVLMNTVAALEMALHNGRHPVMGWDVGPKTGSPAAGDFPDFDSFFKAWQTQMEFLIDQAVQYNNMLGQAHQALRPTPLLSSLMDGCVEKAADVVQGGARYNSSGTSNIGLADVTDSFLVIKKLVFDEKKVEFGRLVKAVDENFANDPDLLALVQNKVNLFGSDDPETTAMARRTARVIHEAWASKTNYRGGRYTSGFWSMSQHVAYGALSSALPSGRLAGKAFTPGLAPSPRAAGNFLDNMAAVAALDPAWMDNNIAYNIKLAPKPGEERRKTVDTMAAYARAYFNMGGMQVQFNTVTSQTLRDAQKNPENYQQLMVRISGFNAYFVTLNADIQTELIERTEYGI